MTDPNKKAKTSSGTLGTFAGVFTPSVLTILGIILFLRTGYVVGSGGVAKSLVIIGVANLISIMTTVSLSAIATNMKVKGGGDYYLISRTLGLEFGGAIGVVLFLAQAVSIAFYCIGFGEALASSALLSAHAVSPRLIAAAAVCFLFVFAWMGADWATKFQYVVMTLLSAGLLSFYIGGVPQWKFEIFQGNWTAPTEGLPFWVLFALFFPAVTGFTQGVSMSGDLKEPGKSLPLGTFLAVVISIVVYFSTAVVFFRRIIQSVVDCRLHGHAPSCPFSLDDRRRGHRGHAFIGHGILSWGAANFTIPFRGPNLSFFIFFCQGRWSDRQSTTRRPPRSRYRRVDHCTGQPEPDRPGGVHVFSHFLRPAQLCHLL